MYLGTTIPTFRGTGDPEAYFIWKKAVNEILCHHNWTERKEMCAIVASFTHRARDWWEDLEYKPRSWSSLTILMRERFAPDWKVDMLLNQEKRRKEEEWRRREEERRREDEEEQIRKELDAIFENAFKWVKEEAEKKKREEENEIMLLLEQMIEEEYLAMQGKENVEELIECSPTHGEFGMPTVLSNQTSSSIISLLQVDVPPITEEGIILFDGNPKIPIVEERGLIQQEPIQQVCKVDLPRIVVCITCSFSFDRRELDSRTNRLEEGEDDVVQNNMLWILFFYLFDGFDVVQINLIWIKFIYWKDGFIEDKPK